MVSVICGNPVYIHMCLIDTDKVTTSMYVDIIHSVYSCTYCTYYVFMFMLFADAVTVLLGNRAYNHACEEKWQGVHVKSRKQTENTCGASD